jgi:hypothetical protein
LLVASLCHDIDHPGVTNAYEVATGSDRALCHNDSSVLENHHSYVTFQILRKPQCNLMAGLGDGQPKQFRAQVISAILATDMAFHFDQCKSLQALKSHADFVPEDEKCRKLLVCLYIHSADLSGQVFPAPVAIQWSDLINDEFQSQAELEERHGLPVAVFMQGLDRPATRTKLQTGFINFVLIPWWGTVCRLFPVLQPCLDNLLANKANYETMIQNYEAAESSASNKTN